MDSKERNVREKFINVLGIYKRNKTPENLIEVLKFIRYVEYETALYIKDNIRGLDEITYSRG